MWPFRKTEPACSILKVVHYKRLNRPCSVIITCTCIKGSHTYGVAEPTKRGEPHGTEG